jgi:hypothetical protein
MTPEVGIHTVLIGWYGPQLKGKGRLAALRGTPKYRSQYKPE